MKAFILSLIQRFYKDDVPGLGSQLAFKLILSFFPFIIFLMTVLGYTSIDANEVLAGLSSILPESVFSLVKATVQEVLNTKSTSLMSLSLIFTLWSSASGFNGVIKGLNKAYGVKENRSFIRVRLTSLLCTLGMTTVIILMCLLLIFSKVIWGGLSYYFHFNKEFNSLWIVLKYLIVMLTTVFVFSSLYRYAPSKRLTWDEVYPGSVFSTFALIMVSTLFAYYVNNFGKHSYVYGSIGAIIFLIMWLFLLSIILLLGGEVNALLLSKNNVGKPANRNYQV